MESKAKSFYIFDFDDNIIHTGSPSYIYHKESGEEKTLSSKEYVKHRGQVGIRGPFKDYYIDPAPGRSFRRFGDGDGMDPGFHPFLEDLKQALKREGWQGPSWERFVKAVTRDRTIAIITARGHHPERIREGVNWLASEGFLPKKPDIYSIYTVTSPYTKNLLKWTGPDLVSPLKKQALRHFFEQVYEDFGHRPEHRFGYSDDDPSNIVVTRKKFLELKQRNPHHSFFLYEARDNQVLSEEVLMSHLETH